MLFAKLIVLMAFIMFLGCCVVPLLTQYKEDNNL